MNKVREAKCEVCGKEGKVSELLMCGGPFSFLCKDCRKTVVKVISRYLDMLSMLTFEQVAGTIVAHAKKRKQK